MADAELVACAKEIDYRNRLMTPGFDPDLVLPNSGKHADRGEQIGSCDCGPSRPAYRGVSCSCSKGGFPVALVVSTTSGRIKQPLDSVSGPRRGATSSQAHRHDGLAPRLDDKENRPTGWSAVSCDLG